MRSAKASKSSYQKIELDLEDDQVPNRSRLMTAMDTLNPRFGKEALHMASAGTAGDKRVWPMKQERLTPGYATRWKDILEVRA